MEPTSSAFRVDAVLVDIGRGHPPLAISPGRVFLPAGEGGRADQVLDGRDSPLRRLPGALPRVDGFEEYTYDGDRDTDTVGSTGEDARVIHRAERTVEDVLALRAAGLQAQPNHVLVSHQVQGFPMKGFPMKGFPMKGFGGAGLDGVFVGGLTLAQPLSRTGGQPGNTWPSTRDPLATSSAEPTDDPGGTAPTFDDAGAITVLVLDTGIPAAPHRPATLTALSGDGAADPADVPDGDQDRDLDVQAGHAAFIAGLIGRLAPGSRVIVRKVLDGEGWGEEVRLADLLHEYAGKVDLVNLSMGTYTPIQPRLLEAAVRSVQSGVGQPQQQGAAPRPAVVVASAGNDATWLPAYPAAFPDVVSVAALDADGPADYTNLGPWVRACAPGTDLVSTFFTDFTSHETTTDGTLLTRRYDGWARWSGTSFAAPVVLAALARAMKQDELTALEAVHRVIDAPGLLRLPMLGTVVNIL